MTDHRDRIKLLLATYTPQVIVELLGNLYNLNLLLFRGLYMHN
jgi:hypothetical protein